MNTTRSHVAVCRTCRPEGAPAGESPPGEALGRGVAAAIARLGAEARVEVRAIACLSACKRACSVSVSAPGKFSYVIGDLGSEDAEAIATFAALHAESADGVPPWRARPEKVRKSTVARVPAAGADHPLVEKIDSDAAVEA